MYIASWHVTAKNKGDLHYKCLYEKDLVNRCVLSFILKVSMDGDKIVKTGKEFQADGSATENGST